MEWGDISLNFRFHSSLHNVAASQISLLRHAKERHDSLFRFSGERFDSPLHNPTERIDSLLHDAAWSQFSPLYNATQIRRIMQGDFSKNH
jgi:hypothetical protein